MHLGLSCISITEKKNSRKKWRVKKNDSCECCCPAVAVTLTAHFFCSLQRCHPVLTRMTTMMTTPVSSSWACPHALCFIVIHVRRVASCFCHNYDPLSFACHSSHTSLSLQKPHPWGLTSCLFPPKPPGGTKGESDSVHSLHLMRGTPESQCTDNLCFFVCVSIVCHFTNVQ